MQEASSVPERDLAFARVHDSVNLVRPRHSEDDVDGFVKREAKCANVGSVAWTQREGHDAGAGCGDQSAVGKLRTSSARKCRARELVGSRKSVVYHDQASARVKERTERGGGVVKSALEDERSRERHVKCVCVDGADEGRCAQRGKLRD